MSSEYPGYKCNFESHLQKVNSPVLQVFSQCPAHLLIMTKQILFLKNQSFKELLAKNPGGDTLKNVLTIKGWTISLTY